MLLSRGYKNGNQLTRPNFLKAIKVTEPYRQKSLYIHNIDMYKSLLQEIHKFSGQDTSNLSGKIPIEVFSLVFLHLAQNIGTVNFEIARTNKLFSILFRVIKHKCRVFHVHLPGVETGVMIDTFTRLNKLVNNFTFVKIIKFIEVDLFSHRDKENFVPLLDSWKNLATTLNKSCYGLEFDHCTLDEGWLYLHPRRFQLFIVRCPTFNDCDLFLLFMHDYTNEANRIRTLKGFALLGTSVRFEFHKLADHNRQIGRRRFFDSMLKYIARSFSLYSNVVVCGNRILEHKGKTSGFWRFLGTVDLVNSVHQNSERQDLKAIFERKRAWFFEEEGMLFHSRCKKEWEDCVQLLQRHAIDCKVVGVTDYKHLAITQKKKWPSFIPRWHRAGLSRNSDNFDMSYHHVLREMGTFLLHTSEYL